MIPPLFAIGDLLGVLFWLVIITFSIISKIRSGQQQPPPMTERPAQVPPQQPVRAGKPTGRNIEHEIEDFLREVRGQPKTEPPPPPPKRVIKAQPVQKAPVSEHVPGQNFGRGLAEHVYEHIGQDSISTRDAGLGDVVELTDERVEDRLHQVFDHDVGNLAHVEDTNMEVKEGTDAAAWEQTTIKNANTEQIRQMLASPQNIGNLFIVSEILKRPEI